MSGLFVALGQPGDRYRTPGEDDRPQEACTGITASDVVVVILVCVVALIVVVLMSWSTTPVFHQREPEVVDPGPLVGQAKHSK